MQAAENLRRLLQRVQLAELHHAAGCSGGSMLNAAGFYQTPSNDLLTPVPLFSPRSIWPRKGLEGATCADALALSSAIAHSRMDVLLNSIAINVL